MEADHSVEEPVDGQPARLEVDAEEPGEEQVGLAGLDRDGGRDAAGLQVPAVGAYRVLGNDAAGLHRLRFPLDQHDAID